MADVVPPNPDSRSEIMPDSDGSANPSESRAEGFPADTPQDTADLAEDGGESGEDGMGLERDVGQLTGAAVDEHIHCAGTTNAAVNQVSQTVLVNIRSSNPSARLGNFKLQGTVDPEFLHMNAVASWKCVIYALALFFMLAITIYLIGAAVVRLVYGFTTHYECYAYCHSYPFW